MKGTAWIPGHNWPYKRTLDGVQKPPLPVPSWDVLICSRTTSHPWVSCQRIKWVSETTAGLRHGSTLIPTCAGTSIVAKVLSKSYCKTAHGNPRDKKLTKELTECLQHNLIIKLKRKITPTNKEKVVDPQKMQNTEKISFTVTLPDVGGVLQGSRTSLSLLEDTD